MNDLVKVKLPIDYISIDGNKNSLVYKLLETSKIDQTRYNDYCNRIEELFNDVGDSFDELEKRLHNLINMASEDEQTFRFLMANQWILKFASLDDVNRLCSNPKFIVSKTIVKMPYSVYIDSPIKKIFIKEISIPIWQKRLINTKIDLITWLFTDTYNTFEERIDALILGNKKEAKELLHGNQWILMHVNEKKRAKIMDRLDIYKIEMSKTIGYDSNKKLVKKDVVIPLELFYDYQVMELELEEIYSEDTEILVDNLMKYVYQHSREYRIYDENELIKNNLWLLNLIPSSSKVKILQLLGIDLEQKKNTTISYKKKVS